MNSSCIRCPQPSSTLLTYDHAGAVAYLDDARGDERPYEGMKLCEHHAHRFSAPRGWGVVDRRHRDMSLFALPQAG